MEQFSCVHMVSFQLLRLCKLQSYKILIEILVRLIHFPSPFLFRPFSSRWTVSLAQLFSSLFLGVVRHDNSNVARHLRLSHNLYETSLHVTEVTPTCDSDTASPTCDSDHNSYTWLLHNSSFMLHSNFYTRLNSNSRMWFRHKKLWRRAPNSNNSYTWYRTKTKLIK
jgi:hypothetical protein